MIVQENGDGIVRFVKIGEGVQIFDITYEGKSPMTIVNMPQDCKNLPLVFQAEGKSPICYGVISYREDKT